MTYAKWTKLPHCQFGIESVSSDHTGCFEDDCGEAAMYTAKWRGDVAKLYLCKEHAEAIMNAEEICEEEENVGEVD